MLCVSTHHRYKLRHSEPIPNTTTESLQQTAEMVTEWFLLAVVASTVMASGGEGTSLQCPDPEDIAPCSCVVNDDNEMDFECPSEITEEKLAEVFTAKMPNNSIPSR